MSFFSDINGFNAKAIKNINDNSEVKKAEVSDEDYSEVDFCLGLNENTEEIYGNGEKEFGLFDETSEDEIKMAGEDFFFGNIDEPTDDIE